MVIRYLPQIVYFLAETYFICHILQPIITLDSASDLYMKHFSQSDYSDTNTSRSFRNASNKIVLTAFMEMKIRLYVLLLLIISNGSNFSKKINNLRKISDNHDIILK